MSKAQGFSSWDGSDKLYFVLGAVFVSSLLLGDVIGGKTAWTPIGEISVGMVPFPVTFLLTDVVNDFFGRRGARFLTWVGFWMALFAFVVLQIATAVPIAEKTYFTQPEFIKIFGGSAQLFVASMIAYLIGQFVDIHVFQFWKGLTASRHLWLRATGSTLVGQAVDTLAINVVFWRWTAKMDFDWIFRKVGREYLVKVAIAVLLTPVVYALHALIVRALRIEPLPHEAR